MAGTGKTLTQKLGYAQRERVLLLYEPEWFVHELYKNKVVVVRKLPADWVHGFFYTRGVLEHFLASTPLEDIHKGLWVSWPKKSSGIQSDVTEQTFRDLILPTGWVDIKVAAIDDTWSGLKFLRRKT